MSNRFITIGLSTAFAALIGLVLGVGQFTKHVMYGLHADAQNIAEQQWIDVQLANEALEYSSQNSQINVLIVLSNSRAEIESLLTRRDKNAEKISSILARLQTRVGSDTEQQCLDAVLDTRKIYVASYDRATKLALDGKRAEAESILSHDTAPKVLNYHEAFRRFAEFQTEEMNGELNKSTERLSAARRKLIVLTLLSTLLAVAIATYVVIRITYEFRSRTRAELAIGRLNGELEERVHLRTLELETANHHLIEEVREREKAEEQVQFLAYYDALTGLPNRTLLRDRMTMAMAAARRSHGKLAVLFLDLDNFKNVNDSLGHSVGDQLLVSVANRLKANLREQDTVARLGGDEFVIVLSSIAMPADAGMIAGRLVSEISKKSDAHAHGLSASCSLGISVFPDDGKDIDDLLRNADAAMYSAKRNGRNNFQYFTKDLNTQANRDLALQTGLRHALERNELFLVYQPQVDMTTGEITGAEALLRWRHPELGLIPPDQFIPVAEGSGLILAIGEWVLRTACSEAKRWQTEGLGAFPVSVNVSPIQFRQQNFPQIVRNTLNQAELSPEFLELELTEGLILCSAQRVMTVLTELKEMGVRLSIDDFGTGYSNLSYLRHFPVYKLKIDRSFVKDIPVNPDDASITQTIISMAKSLRLRVIAEGVETEEQLSFLRANRCDEFQGYYFSKPLTTEDFLASLRQRSVAAR